MFSTSVLAQDLRVCPNVQVGDMGSSASDLQRLHHGAQVAVILHSIWLLVISWFRWRLAGTLTPRPLVMFPLGQN